MNINVTYTPPVPAEGEVTITIPESLAQHLRAVLGAAQAGGMYRGLFYALTDKLPESGRLLMTSSMIEVHYISDPKRYVKPV